MQTNTLWYLLKIRVPISLSKKKVYEYLSYKTYVKSTCFSRSLGGFGTADGSRKGSTRRGKSCGSRARQVSKEYIPEGRRHVAKTASGGRILATIPQGGRRRQRPSRAGALSERTARPPIGTRGQPLVSSLAADDNVNDAPTPLPRSRLSGRICDQPWAERECGHLCVA